VTANRTGLLIAAIAFGQTPKVTVGRFMTCTVSQLPPPHRAGTIPRPIAGLTSRRRVMRLKPEFLEASCFRNDQ
jgi:hypothetical protein